MDEEEHQWQEVETIVSGTCWLLLFIPRSIFSSLSFVFLLLKIYHVHGKRHCPLKVITDTILYLHLNPLQHPWICKTCVFDMMSDVQ